MKKDQHDLSALVKAQENYIHFLENEVRDCAILAHAHGWRSKRVEEGKQMRAEIKALTMTETKPPSCSQLKSLTAQGAFDGCESVGKDVADAWDVPYIGIVIANDLPTVKVFIQWQNAHCIEPIASVAYCPNLMCHIFFLKDDSVVAVQQCSMRTTEGALGFARLIGMGMARKLSNNQS